MYNLVLNYIFWFLRHQGVRLLYSLVSCWHCVKLFMVSLTSTKNRDPTWHTFESVDHDLPKVVLSFLKDRLNFQPKSNQQKLELKDLFLDDSHLEAIRIRASSYVCHGVTLPFWYLLFILSYLL